MWSASVQPEGPAGCPVHLIVKRRWRDRWLQPWLTHPSPLHDSDGNQATDKTRVCNVRCGRRSWERTHAGPYNSALVLSRVCHRTIDVQPSREDTQFDPRVRLRCDRSDQWWLRVDGMPSWMQNRRETFVEERTPNWARLAVLFVVLIVLALVVAYNGGPGWIGGPVGSTVGLLAPRMRFFSRPAA